MEHYDNEQRLRILQERLGQIKNKQEAKHDEQPKVDNTPPYPTYNPKATQSSNEDIAPEQTEKQFAAQVTWDETMADSIVKYLDENPDKQVIHVAGKFHTEQGLGTATSILRRNADLNVVVITPVESLSDSSEDYQLQVLSPPTRYVKQENRMKAYKKLSHRGKGLECK